MKWLACLNLSGVQLGLAPRHDESRAWRSLKLTRLQKPIFVSGSSSGRLAVHVICCLAIAKPEGSIVVQQQLQGQALKESGAASYWAWCAAIAHAIRANLLASAQATTLE